MASVRTRGQAKKEQGSQPKESETQQTVVKSPLTFQNIDVSDVLKFSLSLLNRVIFKYVQ